MQISYRQGVCSITMWCSLCTIGLFWNVASIGGFISYLMLHYLMMFISGLFFAEGYFDSYLSQLYRRAGNLQPEITGLSRA